MINGDPSSNYNYDTFKLTQVTIGKNMMYLMLTH